MRKSKHMQMSLEFLSKYWTTCINFGQLLDEGFSPKISSTLSLIFIILSRERSTLGFSCSSDSETFIILTNSVKPLQWSRLLWKWLLKGTTITTVTSLCKLLLKQQPELSAHLPAIFHRRTGILYEIHYAWWSSNWSESCCHVVVNISYQETKPPRDVLKAFWKWKWV